MTDVIRAWAVRNEQAMRLRLFPRCWTWLLRYATGTECDLIGVVRVNLKNTDRASYEQNQFNHSLEQIRCAMNKQCDLGRCGWREVDVVSEFPHMPNTTNGFETLVATGYRTFEVLLWA